MLSMPKSVLNTNKVNATKTSQLPRKTKVKVSLPRRNVPAATLRNTSKKTAPIRKKSAVFAKSKVTSKLIAGKRNKRNKMTLLIMWKKNVKTHKLNIAQVELSRHHRCTYDYLLLQENIK